MARLPASAAQIVFNEMLQQQQKGKLTATSDEPNNNNSAAHQLRRILDTIFPPQTLTHQAASSPPKALCTLLRVNQPTQDYLEASSEPASRRTIRQLSLALNQSLREHRAKATGLCGVRRRIFDQCFEELIRQVTVACVEQGLLLVRVRNEFRATLAAYELAYNSGVHFGLRKCIQAGKVILEQQHQPSQVDASEQDYPLESVVKRNSFEVGHTESLERMKIFYERELAKKDQVIEQQRAIIRAITQEIADNIGTEPSASL